MGVVSTKLERWNSEWKIGGVNAQNIDPKSTAKLTIEVCIGVYNL